MRFARPIERGIQRLLIVPPSTAIVWMRRSSTDESPPLRSSAFAAADLIAFEIKPAAFFGMRSSNATASSTLLPRTKLATTRILRGDIVIPRTRQRACMASPSGLLPLAGVAVERASERELAELVTDHLLG